MSYAFDGSGDYLSATLGTALSYPITIAAFVKQETFASAGIVAQLGTSGNFSCIQASYVNNNEWFGIADDSSVTRIIEIDDDITADGWVPMIAVFTSASSVAFYVDGAAGSVLSANSPTISSATAFNIGRNPGGYNYFTGRIARVAIWDKALDGTERAQYEAGTVSSTNLRAYWSLESDATKTSGSDSVGSLTVTNATLESGDNPTFLSKYLKLLADSPAASATGVDVVVYSAPSGSDYITGTTRYGSATGKSFEASLESGNAVLKIPAADVGCDGLSASTTVAALARNSTYTTGMVEATIIEE